MQPLAQRRVGVGLDEVRAREVEHPALPSVKSSVGEDQPDQQPRRRRQRDRELMLDAERHEDLVVDLALAEAACSMTSESRYARGSRVAR